MIFVIVPAYNEEQRIGQVIKDLLAQKFENIVVIDDASTDQTAQIAAQAGATVLQHAINRGQGAALQTGDTYALEHDATVVVHFDADGQFNAADISGALASMQAQSADVVFGSRFLDTRSQIPWTKRHIILPVSRLINKLLTGLRLTDAHNGFRILSRKALEKIHISQDRMAHNSDIVRQVKEQDLSFIEHPVEVKYFEYGQNIGGGFKVLQDIITAKFLK